MDNTLTIRDLIPDPDPFGWMQSVFPHTTTGRKLEAALPAGLIHNLTGLLADQIDKLLDMNLLDLFIKTWLKHRELKALSINQGESELVGLIEHRMSSVHEPKIEVMLDGKPVLTLLVNVEFDLLFHGVQLRVCDRRIREVQLGQLEGSAALAIEGHPLVQQPLGEFEVPGSLKLDPGIPLSM